MLNEGAVTAGVVLGAEPGEQSPMSDLPQNPVNVRYMIDDVDAATDFYTKREFSGVVSNEAVMRLLFVFISRPGCIFLRRDISATAIHSPQILEVVSPKLPGDWGDPPGIDWHTFWHNGCQKWRARRDSNAGPSA